MCKHIWLDVTAVLDCRKFMLLRRKTKYTAMDRVAKVIEGNKRFSSFLSIFRNLLCRYSSAVANKLKHNSSVELPMVQIVVRFIFSTNLIGLLQSDVNQGARSLYCKTGDHVLTFTLSKCFPPLQSNACKIVHGQTLRLNV